MPDYTVKRIADMEAVFGGGYKRARGELGIESFGLQVLDFPPNNYRYPEHDHSQDGQEEVYIPLGGSGDIELDGVRHRLEPGMMVRVGPSVRRSITTREEPLRLIAIGGVPGKAYEAPDVTKLGQPDPLAQQ